MRPHEIVRALRRLRVETGSLACAGCGHEHNCGIHGCAIIRGAGNLIDSQRALIQALKQANDDHRDMLAARERAASPAAVDRLMESICDRCRYELEADSQDELDDICAGCTIRADLEIMVLRERLEGTRKHG